MNIFRRILGLSDAPEEARPDTGGVNEIQFEDSAGAEAPEAPVADVEWELDVPSYTGGMTQGTVGGAESISIGGNQSGPVDSSAGLRSDGELVQAGADSSEHEIETDAHAGAAPPLPPDGLVGPRTDGGVPDLGPGELAQASASASEPASTQEWTLVYESIQPVGGNAEASPELAGPTDSDTEGHPDFLWDPRIAPASPASAETPESLPEELSLVSEEIELEGNRSQGKVEYSWKVEEGVPAPEDDVQFVHHHDSGLDGPRSDGDLVQADAAPTEPEPQSGTVMVDDWATRGVAPPPPIDTITGDDGEHDPPDGAPDTMALGESPGGVSEMNKNELIAKVAADANLGAPPEAAPDTMALGESPADASEMTKSELIDTLHKSFEPASDDGPSTMVELSDTSETGAVLAQYGETDLEFVSRHLEAPQDGDEIDDPEL